MEIYQINNDLASSQSQLHHQPNNKNHTHLNAQKRLKQLYRRFYPNFPPFQTFFNHKQYHMTLHKAQPKPYIHADLYDRQRLGIERQTMFYRGAVDEYLDDGILREYIEQANKERGFVDKKGNKSVIKDGVLIHAHESSIRAIQIPRMKNPNKVQVYQQSREPLLLVDFGTGNKILQIQLLQNHQVNAVHKGTILKVRFIRKIILFGVKQRKIISTIQSPSEFIKVSHSIYAKNTLQTIEYDGQSTKLSTYQLQHKQNIFRTHIKHSLHVNGLVNTQIILNRNELLLTKYQGIYVLDKRNSKETQLFTVANANRQKIYNSIPLKANFHFSPYILNCHSRHLTIFDIRKPKTLLKKYLHHCEESPPSIMNFYDGSNSCHLHQPIVVCHSPNPLGSSILLPLNINNLEEINNNEESEWLEHKTPLSNSHLMLLYDKGKSIKNAGLHRFFNESIALLNQRHDQLSVFKVDNEGSVGFQIFKHNEMSGKYDRRQFHSQQPQFLQINACEANYQQAWLKQDMMNKYFLKQTVYDQIVQNESNKDISLPKNKKKAAKSSKLKRRQKKQRKMQQLIQPQTQVDIEQILDGQYQNSSECPQTLSNRKINFVDLTRFYSTLQQKAALPLTQPKNKSNHIDLSLSTQANSQTFNFPQPISIDTGIKTLSFHNKKLMNYSILENLKNDWDN